MFGFVSSTLASLAASLYMLLSSVKRLPSQYPLIDDNAESFMPSTSLNLCFENST
jgi:hypothetical protein